LLRNKVFVHRTRKEKVFFLWNDNFKSCSSSNHLISWLLLQTCCLRSQCLKWPTSWYLNLFFLSSLSFLVYRWYTAFCVRCFDESHISAYHIN
jgi:hypothetical protein